MGVFKTGGNFSAKGACKDGTPSAEAREEEKHRNRMNLRR